MFPLFFEQALRARVLRTNMTPLPSSSVSSPDITWPAGDAWDTAVFTLRTKIAQQYPSGFKSCQQTYITWNRHGTEWTEEEKWIGKLRQMGKRDDRLCRSIGGGAGKKIPPHQIQENKCTEHLFLTSPEFHPFLSDHHTLNNMEWTLISYSVYIPTYHFLNTALCQILLPIDTPPKDN